MLYQWISDYCLTKVGAIKDFKTEWNATRYLVGQKMFALHGTDNSNAPILTLKIEPSYGLQLRQEYKGITPGYYMNKRHWNSINLNGTVPDVLIKEMIDESYSLIFSALSQKAQRSITEGA